MGGTKIGGRKARDNMLAGDPDYYRKLGALGGRYGTKQGVIKGFARDRDRASVAGRIGGLRSVEVRRKAKERKDGV